MPSSSDKYTDPKLRDEVKEEIHQSDKGGAPGQWSARKAQMMASEYKKRGGDYKTDKKDQDESQKHLSKWGEEEWQTKEGSANAKQADGTQKRYLPKKAWEQMSEKEKQETDEKKQKESRKGKQFVQNTEKAKESRQKANKEEDAKHDNKKKREEATTDGEQDKDVDGRTSSDETAEESEGKSGSESSSGEEGGQKKESGEKKRGRPPKSDSASNKKQKDNSGKGKQNGTGTSKHQSPEPPAEKGSKDRLPKKGQKVHWKSAPGFIEGEVVEIAREEKEVDGKRVKGSEEDPRVVLKSSSSGKIAVHKPDAIYFD